MATLKEYFQSDFPETASIGRQVDAQTPSGPLSVSVRVHDDFPAGVRFLSLYVPESVHTGAACLELLRDPQRLWSRAGFDFFFSADQSPGEPPDLGIVLKFSGQVHVYSETEIDEATRRQLQSLRLRIRFRGPRYAAEKSAAARPLAFIAHDSSDKETIARPLARQLSKSCLAPIWYDEFSLRVGGNLREQIEKGLKDAHRCVLLLSHSFIANRRWAKTEFDAIFTRELLERKNVILPVWIGVTPKDVFEYSPSLANVVGLQWSEGLESVAARLVRAIKQ